MTRKKTGITTSRPFEALPLTQDGLSRLYWELHRHGGYCSGEKKAWDRGHLSFQDLVVLSLLQCRYDPRLTAILVEWLPRAVARLDPVAFKSELNRHGALPVAATLGEFVLQSGREIPETSREFFRFLQTGAKPAPLQLFYRGIYPVGGRLLDEAVSAPLWHFKKWGFLAADAPFLKEAHPSRLYRYDQRVRLSQLTQLAREKSPFRLRDYLEKIRFSVSRQQALKDLKLLPHLHKKGEGKGARYVLLLTYT